MTSASAEPVAGSVGARYRWLVTITGMTAAFTMVLSGTIVNVAVPNVMGAFGVGQGEAATRELLRLSGPLLAEEGVPAALREALALDHLASMLEAQAETLAFQDGFHLLALVFIAALIPAWNLSRTSGKPPPAP